jgi:endogenous inhibitor of DNA gyrase (YacG/DUF329 family)
MTCPTCRKPVAKDAARPSKLFPFCSERCHLVDLGRWLGEDYRIPGPPAPVEALAAQIPDDD